MLENFICRKNNSYLRQGRVFSGLDPVFLLSLRGHFGIPKHGGGKPAPTVARSWPRRDLNPHLALRQGRILSKLDHEADLPPARLWVGVVYMVAKSSVHRSTLLFWERQASEDL